jgi:hypothetical protein
VQLSAELRSLLLPIFVKGDVPHDVGLISLPIGTTYRVVDMRAWWRASGSAYGAVRHKIEVLIGVLYRPGRYVMDTEEKQESVMTDVASDWWQKLRMN